MICQHCGEEARTTYVEPTKTRLIENTRCFTCDFWISIAVADQEPENIYRTVITPEWGHRRLGDGRSPIANHRGSYGRTFTVTWLDEVRAPTVTNDLWSQGTIPERWRHLFNMSGSIREGT